MPDQFIRRGSLLVESEAEAVDLSKLRFHFRVNQSDIETPNHVDIRVYNMKSETAQKLSNIEEYTRVILSAGYEGGNFGKVFDGTIKQTRRGRENQTDTYFDILAAENDQTYNFGFVKLTLAEGTTAQDRLDALLSAVESLPDKVKKGYVPDFSTVGLQLARGKVMYGMVRAQLNNLALTLGASWSINDGKLNMIPLTSYLPGEAVVLTMKTGMIGLPQQTQDGIRVRCLLNPRIIVGSAIKIDNASVQRAVLPPEFLRIPAVNDPDNSIFDFFPPLATQYDGLYRVLVNELEGDTRGGEGAPWYCDLTCLAINQGAPPENSVAAF